MISLWDFVDFQGKSVFLVVVRKTQVLTKLFIFVSHSQHARVNNEQYPNNKVVVGVMRAGNGKQ